MTIEVHNGVHVLRDDLLPGGTKSVFLDKILDPEKSVYVYASPVYGAMQIALARYAKSIGKEAAIFCANRKEPHENSLEAKRSGATVYQAPFGYLNNCQAKAKEFAKSNNGQYIEFGANYPVAIDAIAYRMKSITEQLGYEPDQIFCAVGSGTLIKGIIAGTQQAEIIGIQVGAEVKDQLSTRARLVKYPKSFEEVSKIRAPFPSCRNYDLKAWEYCLKIKKEGQRVLFWNVF